MKKLQGYSLMLIATAFFMGVCLLALADRPAIAEDDSVTISGRITSVTYGFPTFFGNRRAELVVQDKKGREHVVRVGQRTAYIPHRTPTTGDRVSIICIRQENTLSGVTVTYK